MRILNISSLYPPNVVGGAELGLQTISEAMVALGHEVHVVTLKPPGKIDNADLRPESLVQVHQVKLANTYWPFNKATRQRTMVEKGIWHSIDTLNEVMALRVRSIIRREQPDIVLTRNLQGFSTMVMPTIKRLGIPLVHVLHDCSLLCPQTTLYRNESACGLNSERCKSCRLLTVLRHRHTNSVDAVIGVSKSVVELHQQHGLFKQQPSTVIYNALKPSIQLRQQPPKREAGHEFTFGFLGRVSRVKGIETLLTAAKSMQENGMNFRLLIAGQAEPSYLQELKERWKLTCVEYLGFVEPGDFLQRLDTLVFPSEWMEALGNGVFEAFSQGVPVIGSDAGGIPESIDHGKTGFVFKKGDAWSLENYMTLVMYEPGLQQKLSRKALNKSLEYSAKNRAQQYIDFLTQVRSQSDSGKAA